MRKIFLSVIIPCYNEADNLKRGVLPSVYKYLNKTDYSWEVLIVDDGSTDESAAIIEKQIKNWDNFTLITSEHGGKPLALYGGIQKAGGEYVLFVDMDQSTPIKEVEKLLPYVDKYSAIIGSRGLVRKNSPFYRRVGSIVFMALRKFFILPDIDDTQCGFKLFKTDLVKKAFPRLEFFRNKTIVRGWRVTSYDVELLHIIERMGNRIKEVRISWKDEDVSKNKGGGLSRYLRESKEMFYQILRVKLNELKGFYL